MRGPVKEIFADLDAQSAGGTAVTLNSGGRYMLMVEAGTWNSASHALQMKSPNGTWIAVGSANTADGVQNLILPQGQYRGVVTIGNPTDLYSYLVPISDGD